MQVFDIAPQGDGTHGAEKIALEKLKAVRDKLEGQLAAAQSGDKTINLKSLGADANNLTKAVDLVVASMDLDAKKKRLVNELAAAGDTAGAVQLLRQFPNYSG